MKQTTETCVGCRKARVRKGAVCRPCADDVRLWQQLIRAALHLEPIKASRAKPAVVEARFRTWVEPGGGDGMVSRRGG